MPIDPSIPLRSVAPQIESPMQTLAQFYGMQQLKQRGELQALQMQEAEGQLADQQLAREARARALADTTAVSDKLGALSQVRGLGPLMDVNRDAVLSSLTGTQRLMATDILQKFDKAATESQKAKADLAKTQNEVEAADRRRRAELARGVRSFGYSPEAVQIAFSLEAKEHPKEVGELYRMLQDDPAPDRIKALMDYFEQQDPNIDRVTLGTGDIRTEGGVITGRGRDEPPNTFEAHVLKRFGPNYTAAQELQARREWEAAGRAPEKPDYAWATDEATGDDVYATPGEIRTRGLSRPGSTTASVLPNDLQTALDRSTLRFPKDQRTRAVETLNRMWAANPDDPQIKQTIIQLATEGENVETKKQIRGRQAMLNSLRQVDGVLDELEKAGVQTGLYRGSWENLQRALGTSSDPRLVRLGTRLDALLVEYRRNTTGVQFSERESEAYARMFPTYKNAPPVNRALIKGLADEASSQDLSYWTQKLGPAGASLVGAIPGSDTAAPPPPAGVDTNRARDRYNRGNR